MRTTVAGANLARILATLTVAAFLGACAAKFEGDLEANRDRIKSLHSQAQLIVVVVVSQVGQPPPAWSGAKPFYQEVQYTMQEILKGTVAGGGNKVRHPVVEGSRTVDTNRPGLSPVLFKVGNRVILFLRSGPAGLETFDENFGVIPGTDQNVKAVKSL